MTYDLFRQAADRSVSPDGLIIRSLKICMEKAGVKDYEAHPFILSSSTSRIILCRRGQEFHNKLKFGSFV
jgi:hypothetical protein